MWMGWSLSLSSDKLHPYEKSVLHVAGCGLQHQHERICVDAEGAINHNFGRQSLKYGGKTLHNFLTFIGRAQTLDENWDIHLCRTLSERPMRRWARVQVFKRAQQVEVSGRSIASLEVCPGFVVLPLTIPSGEAVSTHSAIVNARAAFCTRLDRVRYGFDTREGSKSWKKSYICRCSDGRLRLQQSRSYSGDRVAKRAIPFRQLLEETAAPCGSWQDLSDKGPTATALRSAYSASRYYSFPGCCSRR